MTGSDQSSNLFLQRFTDAANLFEFSRGHQFSQVGFQLLEGSSVHDLTIGSRYVDGGAVTNWSKLRVGLSRAGNAYARTVLGLPVTDSTSLPPAVFGSPPRKGGPHCNAVPIGINAPANPVATTVAIPRSVKILPAVRIYTPERFHRCV